MVNKAIERGLKDVKIAELKRVSRISLMQFANRQYAEISRIRGLNLLVLLACIKITDRESEIVKKMPLYEAESIIDRYAPMVSDKYTDFIEQYDTERLYGVPLQRFSQEYITDCVKPVYERLSKQYPFDPDALPKNQNINVFMEYNKHINSLRNRAELEVRYNGHLENINELKRQGNKLVIASSHADCSERCKKWQGRVYSLDGTTGTTPDGRRYVPLEQATDVYYTTKSGKVWKNGLLGFNCRHYLVPYSDGYKFPQISPKAEAKEYKITEKQRHLERQVRLWRTKAIYEKGTNPKAYKHAKKKAQQWNKQYINYSQKHGRAYYPSRTKVL